MLRALPGLMIALALAMAGGAMMLIAWAGWADRFGWPGALAALLLSGIAGFNAFGILGTLFFALDYLHWPWPESLALASVGFLFASRGVMQGIWAILTAERLPPHG